MIFCLLSFVCALKFRVGVLHDLPRTESGSLKQKVNKMARIVAQYSFIHFSTRVNAENLVISQNQQVIR